MAKIKLLMVDDDAGFIEFMKESIADWGYDLITAFNGRKGIEMVRKEAPDIVVLDYRMPDMNGDEVLKQIRKFNGKIPVILFTAYPNINLMGGVQDLGISAFIPKLSVYSDILPSLREALALIEKNLARKTALGKK